MPSEGPNSASTAANYASGGLTTWSSPGSAIDGVGGLASAALAATGVPGDITFHLLATGFGFAIPAGVTIAGVEVQWRIQADHLGNVEGIGRLVQAGVPDSDPRLTGNWPAAAAYVTLGGAADLWNTALTVAEVNAADFGAAIYAVNSEAGTNTVYLDDVLITVYYSDAPTPIGLTETVQPVRIQTRVAGYGNTTWGMS